jgi:NAD(P)-dependent dehydrogenase (short-subunit alcohol dehydrogenase family)
MKRLESKVAVITGAGSGIGRATAMTMASEGASVVVADIDESAAQKVVAEIVEAGGNAASTWVDVAEEAAVKDMIGVAVSTFGGVDILHNNAAALGPEVLGRDLDIVDMDVDVWDRTMAVNVRGVMLGCKHAIPHMLARGGGSIISASSCSALFGHVSRIAYGTSKGALISFTKYVATMYGPRGIRCNALAPGLILTPAARRNLPVEQFAVYQENHLFPRLGEAQDIANAVLFLASDEGIFINGQTISVDGGLLTHMPYYAQFQRMSQDT